jgi:sRNA-binding carbon storage regulator CsrA
VNEELGNLFATLKYGDYITLQFGEQIATITVTKKEGCGNGAIVQLKVTAPKSIKIHRSNRKFQTDGVKSNV